MTAFKRNAWKVTVKKITCLSTFMGKPFKSSQFSMYFVCELASEIHKDDYSHQYMLSN